MSGAHAEYRYSITCRTEDEAVLSCLRALADFAERSHRKKIAWGNTGKKEWDRDNHCVTFHFSSRRFREDFRQHANKLLGGTRCERRESDSDPASPKER